MIAASTSALNSPTDEDVVHYGQDLAGNGPSSMTNVAASPTAHHDELGERRRDLDVLGRGSHHEERRVPGATRGHSHMNSL